MQGLPLCESVLDEHSIKAVIMGVVLRKRFQRFQHCKASSKLAPMTHSMFVACLLALHLIAMHLLQYSYYYLLAARAAAICTPPSGDPYPHPLAGN